MAAPESPNHSFSNGRRWLIWLNTLLGALAALAIVVMLNYLSAGHYFRFQADTDSSLNLSQQSHRVLDSLTNDVNITIFFEPHGDNEEIYGLVTGLLTEYQQASPRRLHVKTLDYNRDVGAAKEFLARYNLTDPKERDFVFFESGGHTKLVNARDLANYDFNDLVAGRSKFVRRSAFLGELYFTSDIYDVSNPQPMKAYFLTGHHENDPNDSKNNSGYSKLAAVLTNEVNCPWETLSLAGTNSIPTDCQLLIVPASAREEKIPAAELAKIAAYLKQGGRLFALLTVRSGLENVLADWGVGVADRRAWDVDKRFNVGQGIFLTARMLPHPIMNPLASDNRPIEMIFPRPVYPLEDRSKIPGGPDVSILAATSDQGFLLDPKNVNTNPIPQANIPLLVAVEQGTITGVNTPGGRGTRMVIAGDSDFLDDRVIDSEGNHDFARLALTWLLQRPQIMLEGLGPRPIKEYKLHLTHAQTRALGLLFLGGMPGGVLVLGALVWLRRRS